MISYFASEFLRKAQTPEYPMMGFWVQLGRIIDNSDLNTQWYQQNTELIACNSFLTETGFRISFDLVDSRDQGNNYTCIYLFAIDLNQYTDVASDFNGADDLKLLSQLAAYIDISDKGSLDVDVTNIFNFNIPILCSMNLVNASDQVQVSHYNSRSIGSSNYYDIDLEDNKLLDKGSAMDRLKEILSYSRPSELRGSMTIRKNGIIQL